MCGKPGKVVVAMSGGVDSSVAACLLVEQGYDVMGLFMRVGAKEKSPGANGAVSGTTASLLPVPSRAHQGCCSASDAADARFVAGMLGIPFYALNFEEEFDGIIDYFADEYARGRTPNPCVVCNDRLKFGKLMDYADAVGAEYVATGHYARIGEGGGPLRGGGLSAGDPQTDPSAAKHTDYVGGGPLRGGGLAAGELQTDPSAAKRTDYVGGGRRTLLRGCDRQKDQSYVLFGLQRSILDRVLFPIGELTKPQVREIAARYGLPNRDKPDSVEICFVPDRNYARVVRERRPDGFVDGDVVDESGRIVGRHQGIGKYTVGQRRGLGIAAGKPIYVTGLDVLNNRVTVGDDAALFRDSLVADRTNLFVDGLGESFTAQVKIRYLHTAVPATVHVLQPDDPPAFPLAKGGKRGVRVRVVFDEPQRAVTPGQAVVFYDGDVVLGGAWIEHTENGTSGSIRAASGSERISPGRVASAPRSDLHHASTDDGRQIV
jgi:tRNA-specific 2-thiouridylase